MKKIDKCMRPRCSGKGKLESWVYNGDYTRYYVECSKCGIRTRADCRSENEAIDDWNLRGNTNKEQMAILGYVKERIDESYKEVWNSAIEAITEKIKGLTK